MNIDFFKHSSEEYCIDVASWQEADFCIISFCDRLAYLKALSWVERNKAEIGFSHECNRIPGFIEIYKAAKN